MRQLLIRAPLSHQRVRLASQPRLSCLSQSSHSSLHHTRLFTHTRHLSLPLHHDGNAQAANMSLVDEKHEWSALRVRQTFLDYFKQRGHTFGALPPSPSRCMSIDNNKNSAFLIRRPPLRPHPSLHQCGHEPVQGHLPRHHRPLVRLRTAQARRQLAKVHSRRWKAQ